MTSRDVVNRVVAILREVTRERRPKAGHCGTLDPMATGVLVVCIGQATRLASRVQSQPKSYEARFRLGVRTDTDDVTGEVLCEVDLPEGSIDATTILELLPEFTGAIEQVPPRFSAVHVDGKRAYRLARAGQEVEIEPRTVNVHRLELTQFEFPEFELLIECGSGTYIRSIGRDLGERLGCGATMTRLCRTQVGPFDVARSITLDELDPASLSEQLQSPLVAVPHLKSIPLTAEELTLVRNGRSLADCDERIAEVQGQQEVEFALVTKTGDLVAIAAFDSDAVFLKPEIVFRSDSE